MKSDKGKTPLIVLRCADNRQLFEGTGKGNGEAMKYAIYEGNIDRLEKKLKRISNKCKAYGCDFHYEQTGEEFRELKDEKGNKHTARFVLVEAEGTAIINDWEFIAELEHTENGNIITGVAGVEVPERYYTSKPMCEHCNSKRFRKNTYIVRNKQTGEFKQVGKSCLKDFTHGMSAEAVTQYMSLFDTLIEGETPEPGCAFQRYVSTKEYLLYVAETIRHFGYTRSSDEGISTASQAIDFYDAAHGRAVTKEYLQDLIDKMESVNFDIDNQSSVELVSNALVWISEQEENNNYIHNLKTACSLEYVKGNFGLYASLFPAYDRDLERTAKRKAVQSVEQSSEFVGEISDRITVKIQSVKCVKEKITADSAEPKSIDRLRELGLKGIRKARKGKDSINNGIDFIQDYHIIIHPRCVNFITEISNYQWDKDAKTGKKLNRPIDDFNHLMDAMRYAIEQMAKGDAFSFD